MKIESSFVDTYDLQHSMDHDFLWKRETTTKFSDMKLPEGVLAAIQYVGRKFIVSKYTLSEINPEEILTDGVIDEPLVLILPTDSGGTVVITNPSTLQIGGIAKVEGNPYRMHQEIETFLANRGKLTDVRNS